jgi:hypothetical protein
LEWGCYRQAGEIDSDAQGVPSPQNPASSVTPARSGNHLLVLQRKGLSRRAGAFLELAGRKSPKLLSPRNHLKINLILNVWQRKAHEAAELRREGL